jgi:hypothetical protein
MFSKIKALFIKEELSELDEILSVFTSVVSKLNSFRQKVDALQESNKAAIDDLFAHNAELELHATRAEKVLMKLEEFVK